jgi:uncharacterized protein
MSLEKFIVNPATGDWGIAKEGSESELLSVLKQKSLPLKNYLGVYSIILNTTNKCNMNCIYCSASDNRSKEGIPKEIAKKAVEEATKLELTPRIVFHGSEPLLNMPLINSTVKYGKSLPREVFFYIQSNLTALTDEKLDFIRKNRIGVSTSIDGFREQHDMSRKFVDGSPSYDIVMRNMEKIMKYQEGMFTVTVVTKYNVNSLSEIALNLEKRGVTHIQFLPSVKCEKSEGNFMPTNKELTENYIKLFEQTFKRMESGEQTAIIRNLPQFFASLFLRTGVDSCRICSSANYHPILAVDIDGEIYPCDYFFGDRQYSIGNVMKDSFKDVLNSKKNLRSKSIEDFACGSCDVRRICGGGCMADRIFSGGKPYYCETYSNIYHYLGSKIPELREKKLLGKLMKNL